MDVFAALRGLCKGHVGQNEPLSSHTSFRIGGPADCFLWAEDTEDVRIALETAASASVPFMVIGSGTNLLVSDEGFRGIVAQLGGQFRGLSRDEAVVDAGAGVNLSKVLHFCARQGLSGLECAAGIPGTVGGALYTNAGTRTGWVRDPLRGVTVIGHDKKISTIDPASFRRGERTLREGEVIIEASFQLTQATEEKVRLEMKRLLARRRETQPVREASAGCIFSNPADQSAGRLIDECGCKGMRVGGALVSEKHANFIINTGTARSKDVIELIERVRERVHAATGIVLQLEINVVHPRGEEKSDDEPEERLLQ